MENKMHLHKEKSRSQSRSSRNKKFRKTSTNSGSDNLLNLIDFFETALDGIGEECDQKKKMLEKLQSVQTKIESKISFLSYAEAKMLEKNQKYCSSLSLNAVDSEYEKFLSKVACPFCKQDQNSTFHLVKHIDTVCTPHLMKQLKKSVPLPYSTFQILSNNTFKCNVCPNSVNKTIKYHFYHSQKDSHQSYYLKASSGKTFKDNLFCVSCKILVSNNFTELDHHINHEHHKCLSTLFSVKRNNFCIISSNDKLKCLLCNSHPTFTAVEDFFSHFSTSEHLKNLKTNEKFNETNENIFCELCRGNFCLNTLVSHLSSDMHKLNKKKSDLESLLQFCLFCKFKCFDLMELSNHMTSGCNAINLVRKSPTYKSIKLDENENSANLKYQKEKSGQCNCSNENVDLGISDEENMNEELASSSTSTESDFEEENQEKNDFSMDTLIGKISFQIMYSLKQKENDSHNIITQDCKKSLDLNCESIGLNSFTLSDPSVTLTLFCQSNFQSGKYLNNEGILKFVLETNKYELANSGLWEEVEVNYKACVPHISCIHKATNMRCNITFVEEEKKLRNFLRDCVKIHTNLQIFFHLVKFWFEAHKINLEEMCIVCLVIFFLIRRKMVNIPVEVNEIHETLLKDFSKEEKTRGVQDGKESASAPISEIFQKFLLFLHYFDFINFSICLPIARPVPKKILSISGHANLVQYSSSQLCILGPSLQINFGSNATKKILKKLNFIVQKTI